MPNPFPHTDYNLIGFMEHGSCAATFEIHHVTYSWFGAIARCYSKKYFRLEKYGEEPSYSARNAWENWYTKDGLLVDNPKLQRYLNYLYQYNIAIPYWKKRANETLKKRRAEIAALDPSSK
jgi:hypothetical protein